MSLHIATLLVGLIYLLGGIGFFFEKFKPFAIRFLRSSTAAYLLGCIAIAWFMWILYNLGEADFGQYKHLLMLLFGGAGLLSFKYLPDFLSVRALCVILILIMRLCVDAAFMIDLPARFLMVSLAYFMVVACIYYGCLPYRLRDTLVWLFKKRCRAKSFALAMSVLGVSTLVSILFY